MASSSYDYFTDTSNTLNNKSDVILIVGQERFYCHRLLLSLVSPVFARMFDGQFQEHDTREIILEGKKSESILALLTYIYPQFNREITDNNIEDFLLLADEYMIEHLKQPCKDALIKQLQSFKFVLLPTEHKLQQQSKSFHTSTPTPDSSQHHHDESLNHLHTDRTNPSHRPTPTTRHSSTKLPSTYSKTNDKNNSTSNSQPRYVLFLDKTQIPKFYNTQNIHIPFTTNDLELWFRRLRILYQVDKGRYYIEVIDHILSILQFIPSNLLCTATHITKDTYSIDEIILNDIARARMYMLEEWTTDGDPHRLINLSESYRILSPKVLATDAQQSIILSNGDENPSQETILTSPNSEATAYSFQFTLDSD
ncbi:unnamed protein product [Adineta steineri]|uniref:BTB domain-containing protein n=1 Tax=Adineta steineri TaxID=433720 RepID=A0A813TU55_9BILA|nr:unnamed protein product [Adineta steineri]CAF0813194.1 unnamed protein product [Adineta steineri]